MLMRCGREVIRAADVKAWMGVFDELDYSALNSHAGVHAGAVAAWLRAPSTDPVWVRIVCRFQLGERVWSVHGDKDEEYQR